jgi:putative two-component system response regulator
MMKKKILLIDDDDAVLKLLSARLASRYEVACAQDPRSGIAFAEAQRPDVVVCDIDMPGMNGGEVARALAAQEATRGIPVVYLTALVSPDEIRDLHGDVSGRPGVSKRAPLADLVAAIDEALAARAHTA